MTAGRTRRSHRRVASSCSRRGATGVLARPADPRDAVKLFVPGASPCDPPRRLRDTATWERLRRELWPVEPCTHAPEIAQFFAGTLKEPQAVLVAEDNAGEIMAFAELSIRRDIPGLEEKPTGYVEGLYVMPTHRGSGVARLLLIASRDWGRAQHCVAFASDRADRIIVDPKCRESKFASLESRLPHARISSVQPPLGRCE